jgi:hypothetical protein
MDGTLPTDPRPLSSSSMRKKYSMRITRKSASSMTKRHLADHGESKKDEATGDTSDHGYRSRISDKLKSF